MKFISSIFLCIAIGANAQNATDIITYFDKDWKQVTPKDACYYRTAKELDGKWEVKDYFKNSNKVQMEARCTQISPQLEFEGKAVWYFENGRVSHEAIYVNNQKTGDERWYYEDGKPFEHMIHRGDKHLYCQHWLESGEAILKSGNGVLSRKNDIGSTSYREVRDSLMIAAYTIYTNPQDTVFIVVEVQADYRGGLKSMYRDMMEDLKYPKAARRMGIEGKIFIEFVINKQGRVENPKVLRGIGGGCDEVAVQAFLKQKNWIPALYKGKPVKQKFVLPVNFKLS